MPRVPYAPEDDPAIAQAIEAIRARRGGRLLNLDRMLLNSPALAAGWNTYLGAVRTGLALPAKLRELAICFIAVVNHSDYELQQHLPELRRAGGTERQARALGLLAIEDETVFDASERAVLQLTLEMTRNVQVSDATFARAASALGDHRQLVELVGVIATYNMVSRFLVALDVEAEQE